MASALDSSAFFCALSDLTASAAVTPRPAMPVPRTDQPRIDVILVSEDAWGGGESRAGGLGEATCDDAGSVEGDACGEVIGAVFWEAADGGGFNSFLGLVLTSFGDDSEAGGLED